MNLVFKNGKINPKYEKPSQLIQACIENLTEKQKALVESYHLDQLKAFAPDEEKGTLCFALQNGDMVEFDVTPVGIWNSKTNQWVWSWSSGDDNNIFCGRASALKGLQEVIIAPDFSEAVISCDAHNSQILSCVATEFLGGIGRFVAPEGDFRMHFALMKQHG